MRTYIFILALGCTLLSCNLEEDSQECSNLIADSPGAPSLQIVYKDENGTNLISNGTFDPTKFKAELNGNLYPNMPLIVSDSIVLHSYSTSTNDNRWLLQLSETDTDTLDYTLSYTDYKNKTELGVLCGTTIDLVSAKYNQVPITWDSSLGRSRYIIPIVIIKKNE